MMLQTIRPSTYVVNCHLQRAGHATIDGAGAVPAGDTRGVVPRQKKEPFFTTKPSGLGIGLGLDISHNIVVEKHQGEMRVVSEPGKTCFEVRLPVTPP